MGGVCPRNKSGGVREPRSCTKLNWLGYPPLTLATQPPEELRAPPLAFGGSCLGAYPLKVSGGTPEMRELFAAEEIITRQPQWRC